MEKVGDSIKPNESVKSEELVSQTDVKGADKRYDVSKLTSDPHCLECQVKYKDPRPKDLVMFLHAWAYSGSDWGYRTELPDWSREDWVDTNNEKDFMS